MLCFPVSLQDMNTGRNVSDEVLLYQAKRKFCHQRSSSVLFRRSGLWLRCWWADGWKTIGRRWGWIFSLSVDILQMFVLGLWVQSPCWELQQSKHLRWEKSLNEVGITSAAEGKFLNLCDFIICVRNNFSGQILGRPLWQTKLPIWVTLTLVLSSSSSWSFSPSSWAAPDPPPQLLPIMHWSRHQSNPARMTTRPLRW